MKQIINVPITNVIERLGGGPVRGTRCRAWFRDGRGLNLSIDAKRGLWHDFVTGEGGGILQLVEVALGCDRSAALAWLGERFGIEATPARTAEERRRYAQRIDGARRLATELVERRDEHLRVLRCAAQNLLAQYHRMYAEAEAEHSIEKLARAEDVFAWQEEICARRARFANATGPELEALFRECERQAAA